MKKYVVAIEASRSVFASVWVEADSEEAARDMAMWKVRHGFVGWEDGDVFDPEVFSVELSEPTGRVK